MLLSLTLPSYKAVAEHLNVSAQMVYAVMSQEWAKAMVTQIVHDKHDEGIAKRIATHAAEAIKVLADQMNDIDGPPLLVQKAAFKFLDLEVGQKIKITEETTYGDLDEEDKRIERELRAIQGTN